MKSSKVRPLQVWASGSAGGAGVGSVVVSGRTVLVLVLVVVDSAVGVTGDVKYSLGSSNVSPRAEKSLRNGIIVKHFHNIYPFFIALFNLKCIFFVPECFQTGWLMVGQTIAFRSVVLAFSSNKQHNVLMRNQNS